MPTTEEEEARSQRVQGRGDRDRHSPEKDPEGESAGELFAGGEHGDDARPNEAADADRRVQPADPGIAAVQDLDSEHDDEHLALGG